MAREPLSCYRLVKLDAKEAAISSTIFIGNLSFETTEEELRNVLTEVDPAVRVRIGTDRVTGRPRGFAFAQFADAARAADAIRRFATTALHHPDLTCAELLPLLAREMHEQRDRVSG